jgi:hypothetical protein
VVQILLEAKMLKNWVELVEELQSKIHQLFSMIKLYLKHQN